MLERFLSAVKAIEAAEKMAPAGSHEHSLYVKAALANAWPVIQAYAKFTEATVLKAL